GAQRHAVEVALPADGIVAPDGVNGVFRLRDGNRIERGEMPPLGLQFITGYFSRGAVGKVVGRAVQPGHSLVVERFQIPVIPVVEEIALYVFDHVLHLTLALGIRPAAEPGGDAALADIAPEP